MSDVPRCSPFQQPTNRDSSLPVSHSERKSYQPSIGGKRGGSRRRLCSEEDEAALTVRSAEFECGF